MASTYAATLASMMATRTVPYRLGHSTFRCARRSEDRQGEPSARHDEQPTDERRKQLGLELRRESHTHLTHTDEDGQAEQARKTPAATESASRRERHVIVRRLSVPFELVQQLFVVPASARRCTSPLPGCPSQAGRTRRAPAHSGWPDRGDPQEDRFELADDRLWCPPWHGDSAIHGRHEIEPELAKRRYRPGGRGNSLGGNR